MQNELLYRERTLSSPSPERLRAWRLYFESALAVIDVLDGELERDAGLPMRWYDVLVQLEDAPDGLRMNELAERILPPPLEAPPDMARLIPIGSRNGIEILGPPGPPPAH